MEARNGTPVWGEQKIQVPGGEKAPVRPGAIQTGRANKGEMEEKMEAQRPPAQGKPSEAAEVQVQLQPLTRRERAAA